jgi:hypothetical protein
MSGSSILTSVPVHPGAFHITKADNAHLRTQLIESAWAYQHRPTLGVQLRACQRGATPATIARSWAAQQRLCARFRRLSARKTKPQTRLTPPACRTHPTRLADGHAH